MKHKFVFSLLLSVILLAGGTLTASADDNSRNAVMTMKGRVDAFDIKRKELVVDDMAYVVDEKTPVKSAGGLPLSTSKIRVGREVELLLLGSSVQEVRILK